MAACISIEVRRGLAGRLRLGDKPPLRSGRPGGRGLFSILLLVVFLLGHMLLSPSIVFSGKVYDQAMKRGVVRFGVPYNRAPQGFFDANGKLVGFEVDLASEIARRMNLKIETAKVNEKTWGPMLSGGQIDAAVCGVKHTRSLESQFDFSIPYFFDAPHILVMKGQFKVPSDLNGHKIAAVQGAPFEKDAMQILRDSGDKMAEKNVVSYPDRPSCFLALGREKVAGWIDSGMILLEYGAKNPARFALISAGDAVEPVAVALPQDDSAWRDLVNFTIQDLAADGALKTLYDKWFGPDTPHAFPMKRTIEIWPE